MKINRADLIKDLKTEITNAIEQAQVFKQLSPKQLNHKENEEKWSILECLEHTNLYGDFYLKEIEQQILNAKPAPSAMVFKSGVFGNYFANSMKPKTDGTIPNKMKTFKDKNPVNSNLSVTVIDRFIKQQQQMLNLLEQGKQVDLMKTKTRTTLPLIKFQLGDTFRFVIYHIDRHIVQANKIK